MNKPLTPSDIRAMPVADRLDLIAELWDSLDTEAADVPLPDWHREELDRRLDRLADGSSEGSSWDEVRCRIVARP